MSLEHGISGYNLVTNTELAFDLFTERELPFDG